MAQAAATRTMIGKPLIESDPVEGTTVYDASGNKIGSIKRLMIDKVGGRVAYAVMSFGGFLGMAKRSTSFHGASSTTTRTSAAIVPKSPSSNSGARRAFTVIGIATGRTAPASASCTITGARHIIGASEPDAVSAVAPAGKATAEWLTWR